MGVANGKESLFLQAFRIQQGDVVCFSGAGGKTSLMFQLAQEARKKGFKVLVTTSTRIRVPDDDQCDALDLSGSLFEFQSVIAPGIYVGGLPTPVPGKMMGVDLVLLDSRKKYFDLLLIEADGAACKPLKGWNNFEPVIPDFATKTIGVLDIETIGSTISEDLVHRLTLFTEITGGRAGEVVSLRHLSQVIRHDRGLFFKSKGERILYINKVESWKDRHNVDCLLRELTELHIVAGSIQQGSIYV